MPPAASVFSRAALGVSIGVGLYAVAIGLLLTPSIQRFALYANSFNTLFLDNLYDPRKFGFAKNQVTPFNIRTPDGEKLFAWHILPVDVYTRNEQTLRDQEPAGGPVDVLETTAFKLLKSANKAETRVIVSFHGNAGHVAQGHRPSTLRQLSTLPNTHILTLDYRGFGLSTGSPSESGLITDGTALVNWLLHVAEIPPENIVILGQSLGTAVASSVALRFASPSHELIPPEARETHLLVGTPEEKAPIVFAGVVLVAPFSSLPSLLLTYRIGGIFPLLMPLRLVAPRVAEALAGTVVDSWPSAERLAAYVDVLRGSPRIRGAGGRGLGGLQLVHAENDMDISFRQTEMICQRVHAGREEEVARCAGGIEGPRIMEFHGEGTVGERYEILSFGGHNKIQTFTPVMSAVMRALGMV